MSDMAREAARVAARKRGRDRVSNKRERMSQIATNLKIDSDSRCW